MRHIAAARGHVNSTRRKDHGVCESAGRWKYAVERCVVDPAHPSIP
jgi:hypothetical protein